MRSPVNWGLLGLVIERPSYAYNLAQRFERRYGTVLQLSNIGHVYTALGVLDERGFVKEIPGTRSGRQPKPRYRATPLGLSEYRTWLVGQAEEDRRRRQLFMLALGALAGDREAALATLGGYEQTWLAEGMSTPIARDADEPLDRVTALLGRLIDEDNRLVVGARLEWVEYARRQLQALPEAPAQPQPGDAPKTGRSPQPGDARASGRSDARARGKKRR